MEYSFGGNNWIYAELWRHTDFRAPRKLKIQLTLVEERIWVICFMQWKVEQSWHPLKRGKKYSPRYLKYISQLWRSYTEYLWRAKTDALDVSFLNSLYSYSRIKHLLLWETWEFSLAHYSEITSPQASKYSL